MTNKKDSFRSLLKKYEFLATGAVVAVFLIFLTFQLLIPNLNKAQEIFENKQALTKRLTNLEKKSGILISMDDKALKDNFAKLNYVIPENKDYSLLFTTLDSLQEKLGIAITRTDFELGSVSTSSSITRNSKKGESFAIPISLEVIGSFEQLRSFLTSLSDFSGRLITVDNIRLQLIGPGIIKATLSGKTYFNPLPRSIGSVEAPIPVFNDSLKVIFDRISENQYPLELIEGGETEVPLGRDNLFF